jgi:hypothetical protein
VSAEQTRFSSAEPARRPAIVYTPTRRDGRVIPFKRARLTPEARKASLAAIEFTQAGSSGGAPVRESIRTTSDRP